MAFILSDRVKESSTTTGNGTLSLDGAITAFQSFSTGIGEGNETYYAIENEARWEVGIGTYTSNTLVRNTVLESSNSDNLVDLSGVSTVFCTYPAERSVHLNSSGWLDLTGYSGVIQSVDGNFEDVTISGNLNIMPYNNQFITMKRSTSGNFFHAYIDDVYDRTIALYSNGSSSPMWKFGLKSAPTFGDVPPDHGYIYGEDGSAGIVANSTSDIAISNSDGFVVTHQGEDLLRVSNVTGVFVNTDLELNRSTSATNFILNNTWTSATSYERLRLYGQAADSFVLASEKGVAGGTRRDLTLQITNTNVNNLYASGHVSTSGGIKLIDVVPSNTSNKLYNNAGVLTWNGSAVSSVSYTAGSGMELVGTEFHATGVSAVSGWAGYKVSTGDTAVSGWARHYVDTQDHSAVAVSGWTQHYVDNQDHSAVGVSGWARNYVDTQDHSAVATSGWAEYTWNIADVALSGWAGATFSTTNTDTTYTAGSGMELVGTVFHATGVNAVSGWAGYRVNTGDAAVSGWARNYVDTQDHSAVATSGWAEYTWNQADLAVSGWAAGTFGAGGGDLWSDPVDAVITPDGSGTRDLATASLPFSSGFFNTLNVGLNTTISEDGDILLLGNASAQLQFSDVNHYIRRTTSFLQARVNDKWAVSANGNRWIVGQNGGWIVGGYLGWSDTSNTTPDTYLYSDAADEIDQRNGTNPQSFAVYSTYTSATDYERIRIYGQTGDNFVIAVESGSAGGTNRNLELQATNVIVDPGVGDGILTVYGGGATDDHVMIRIQADGGEFTEINAHGSAEPGAFLGQTWAGKSTWHTTNPLLLGTKTADPIHIGTDNATALIIDQDQNTVFDAGDIVFGEKADHSAVPTAGSGYLWVKSDTPNSLYFTNDAGTDHDLTGVSGWAAGTFSTTDTDTTYTAGSGMELVQGEFHATGVNAVSGWAAYTWNEADVALSGWAGGTFGAGGAFTADVDTQITPTTAIVLDHASNAENALDLSYTVNKAAGDDIGFRLNRTNTLSPGTSYLMVLEEDSAPIFRFSTAGNISVDADNTSAAGSYLVGGREAFNFFGGTAYGSQPLNVSAAAGLTLTGAAGTKFFSITTNTKLYSDVAYQFDQRNGVNPNSYAIYSTYTSATDYERLRMYGQTGDDFVITIESGVTGGAVRNLNINVPNLGFMGIDYGIVSGQSTRLVWGRIATGGSAISMDLNAGHVRFKMESEAIQWAGSTTSSEGGGHTASLKQGSDSDKPFIYYSGPNHPTIGDNTWLRGGFGAITLIERADHFVAPLATSGEIWVKDDAPNVLYFTDDAGTDWDLIGVSGWAAGTFSTTDTDTTYTAGSGMELVQGAFHATGVNAVSGWAKHYVDSQDHSAVATSGWALGTFSTAAISTFGATLTDDVDAATARATIGLDELSKSITIEDPTATEDISLWFSNKAITITEIRVVLVGSLTPSVTWTVRHGTDRSATGAEAVTGGTATTSTTSGSDVTVFNDATVVVDSFIWLETTAQSGTVDEMDVTIFYTID
jgi:hypothetical protein